jgi:uncharacterized FAD-dependent dehydrogenase
MKQLQLTVSPEVGYDEKNLTEYLKKQHLVAEEQYYQIEKRSIDARKKNVKVNLRLTIDDRPIDTPFNEWRPYEKHVGNAPVVVIVGAGPAGLFAALRAIELGVKPILIERGKDVRARRRDLAAINKDHIVNPDSNYCFGEGGAGTYSDGKLYTRSKKRGSVRKIYETLVAHGATEEILYESHPHIGTNKLPKLVTALRETVIEHGGQILFDSRVTRFLLRGDEMKGVELQDGTKIEGEAVVLATGHSARDIFRLCKEQSIKIEAKPFALGVRLEHPQSLIDQIQYSCENRGDYLPAAAYSLVHQTYLSKKERGVFSFCMCPGGFIVPAATAPGELVVNGMSPSRRNSRFANSGIVVAVELEDIPGFHKYEELAALEFQASVEQQAWKIAGSTQAAPAQRMTDFVNKKVSSSLNETSYQPGLSSVDMTEVLPHFIGERLRQGLRAFGKKMKGYMTEEAQLIGVESRTSSPVRIPRNRESCEHPEMKRLFPCGEGAGYAGGIVSAAMDGERCIENAINTYIVKN